jgi:hypothetical protein
MGTENEMDELFQKAFRLEKRGEWEQAISLYEQAVRRWGDQPEADYARKSADRLREMQDNARLPPGEATGWIVAARKAWSRCPVRRSVNGALILIVLDVAIGGSYTHSILVCPVWLLFSVLFSAMRRPGWGLALLRIAFPVFTLGLVMANNALQLRIAEANASRVVAACEDFRAANGSFPKELEELVPQYLPAVPPAKYCMYGQFSYVCDEGRPSLWWVVVPPVHQAWYDFDGTRQWVYMD